MKYKDKLLVLRLNKKHLLTTSYDIVVTRKRSASNSRLDKIGSSILTGPYSWIQIDLRKLYKYLLEKNVTISTAVIKLLGYSPYHRKKEKL